MAAFGVNQMLVQGRQTCRPFSQTRHQRQQPAVSISCSANACKHEAATGRRATLSGIVSLPAALIASRAWALIPDDDDEDLVASAKAKRSQKLKEELGTQKKFARSEGFRDVSLAPVQRAVRQLAVVGSQLSTGDLPAVQTTLSGAWFDELDSTAKASADWKDFTPVCQSILSMKDAAKGGDLKATKQKYVTTVARLQSWTQEAGIADGLRGL